MPLRNRERIESTWVCQECNKPFPDNYDYCPACMDRLSLEAQENREQQVSEGASRHLLNRELDLVEL